MSPEPKLKPYSGPLSLFTAKVRIALAEKRLEYERVEVGWSLADRYEPHHPEVVAKNPKREVPVLVDGDFSVADIASYVFLNAAATLGSNPGDASSRHSHLRDGYRRTGEPGNEPLCDTKRSRCWRSSSRR
jgi:glutathione S-transferase